MTDLINESLSLLSKKINKHTSGESTSVSMAKAEEIMIAINNCIREYETSLDMEEKKLILLSQERLETRFNKGLIILKSKICLGKELLEKLKQEAVNIDSIAYKNTIYHGIDPFFEQYNPEFGTNIDAGDIDYQLAMEIEDLSGVNFILEYLKRLRTENKLLQNYSVVEIEGLLRGYEYNFKDYLFNIYEIVLSNLIGMGILDKGFERLSISVNDRAHLYHILSNLNETELDEKVDITCNKILVSGHLGCDIESENYMKTVSGKIKSYIKHGVAIKNLDKIFVTSVYDLNSDSSDFLDGDLMSPDKLRYLIKDLNNLTNLIDKVNLIKDNVHSLKDYIDIVSEAFYENEYEAVFQLLHDTEIKVLIEEVKHQESFYGIDNLKDWERAFIKYYEHSNIR